MKERQQKPVSVSRAEQVHIIMPADVNSGFCLFGGILMQWIDVVAGVVARRHSDSDVLTAAVDHLEFLAPAHLDDIVTLMGRVTYVGNTSMEVCVDTYVERRTSGNERIHVNRAYLTMVAVDAEGSPTSVPGLLLTTDEERADYEMGVKRRAARINARKNGY